MAFGFLHPVCEEANKRKVLYSSLLWTFWKGVTSWVAYPKNCTFEEVHHAFLFV